MGGKVLIYWGENIVGDSVTGIWGRRFACDNWHGAYSCQKEIAPMKLLVDYGMYRGPSGERNAIHR
jgi:hypothetical protein